jgi:hypothetical protein
VSRVIKKITIVERELGARIDGSFDRVAVMHTGPINELKSILSLRKVKAMAGARNRNT